MASSSADPRHPLLKLDIGHSRPKDVSCFTEVPVPVLSEGSKHLHSVSSAEGDGNRVSLTTSDSSFTAQASRANLDSSSSDPTAPFVLSSISTAAGFSGSLVERGRRGNGTNTNPLSMALGLAPSEEYPNPPAGSLSQVSDVSHSEAALIAGKGEDAQGQEMERRKGKPGPRQGQPRRGTVLGGVPDLDPATDTKGGNSRYKAQKRRDWFSFAQYLKGHSPPLTLSECTADHAVRFMVYLDQFGKTKVHFEGCRFYGVPSSTSCECPMKQSWGSLDALVGRLRAAFDENAVAVENNPFAQQVVRTYLKEVRDAQGQARGLSHKKKRGREMLENGHGGGGERGSRFVMKALEPPKGAKNNGIAEDPSVCCTESSLEKQQQQQLAMCPGVVSRPLSPSQSHHQLSPGGLKHQQQQGLVQSQAFGVSDPLLRHDSQRNHNQHRPEQQQHESQQQVFSLHGDPRPGGGQTQGSAAASQGQPKKQHFSALALPVASFLPVSDSHQDQPLPAGPLQADSACRESAGRCPSTEVPISGYSGLLAAQSNAYAAQYSGTQTTGSAAISQRSSAAQGGGAMRKPDEVLGEGVALETERSLVLQLLRQEQSVLTQAAAKGPLDASAQVLLKALLQRGLALGIEPSTLVPELLMSPTPAAPMLTPAASGLEQQPEYRSFVGGSLEAGLDHLSPSSTLAPGCLLQGSTQATPSRATGYPDPGSQTLSSQSETVQHPLYTDAEALAALASGPSPVWKQKQGQGHSFDVFQALLQS